VVGPFVCANGAHSALRTFLPHTLSNTRFDAMGVRRSFELNLHGTSWIL
jgi:hypothetical protein